MRLRAFPDWSLVAGQLGMLHVIGHVGPRETNLFIRKHVFPGGSIPGLSEVIIEMERCGLEVLDIKNLRRHYALTLDEWERRFEARWATTQTLDPQRFDERFYRVWRPYLIGCAEGPVRPDPQVGPLREMRAARVDQNTQTIQK